jgi:hypothetical protein
MKAFVAFCITAAILWVADEHFAGGRHTEVVVKAQLDWLLVVGSATTKSPSGICSLGDFAGAGPD